MRFCTSCGAQADAQQRFCENCGAPLTEPVPVSVPQPVPDNNVPRMDADSGAVRSSVPAPGFSERCNDPEILRGLQKNQKAGAVFAVFLIPLPLIGFVIYGIVSDKMPISQAFFTGAAISAVFLVCMLLSKVSAAAKQPYEAVVTDKKSCIRTHNRDENDCYTEYKIKVQTTDGRKKTIVETDRSRVLAWHYLKIGDRFRYHPKFAFPYELYDKSAARCLYCVVCQTENPTEADRCRKCGVPLLK